MYYNKTLKKYLDDLAARKPVPGGGAAAALAAAMGASLISMVVNFTLGRPKYEKYQKELQLILSKSENLRKLFLALVDLDIAAYQSKNIKKAMEIPLKVCRLSLEALSLCPDLAKKGNSNLISDAAVAAVLLEAAFTGAYFNVEINLQNLFEDGSTRKIRKELKAKAGTVRRIRRETEEKVGEIIRRQAAG
ncbi:MAG: cyclodeaminase/cyclohydrolase family protein [Candidatus Omnitrophica bacterium]|nr:cyclodeaminase/cyclohydrolase family protein [Candidatus Omnitrophota bacterium]